MKNDISHLENANSTANQSSIPVNFTRATTVSTPFTPSFTTSFTPYATAPSPSPPPAPPAENFKNYFENNPIENIITRHTPANIQNQGLEYPVEASVPDLELGPRIYKRSGEDFMGVDISYDTGVDVSTTPNVVRRARLKEAQRVSNIMIQKSNSNNTEPDPKLFNSYDNESYDKTTKSLDEKERRTFGLRGTDTDSKTNYEAEDVSLKNEKSKVRGVSSSYWEDYEDAISSNYQRQLQPSVQPIHPFKDEGKSGIDNNNDKFEIPSIDRSNSVLFPFLSSGNTVEDSSSFSSSFQPSILLSDRRENLGIHLIVNDIEKNKNVMREKKPDWDKEFELEVREKRKDDLLTTERTPYEIPGGVPASLESSILDLADIMQALSSARTSVKKERPRRGEERGGGEREKRQGSRQEEIGKNTQWDDGSGITRTERERERESGRGMFYPGSLETSASSSPSSSPPSLDSSSD